MKTKILIVSLFLSLSLVTFSQESQNSGARTAGFKTPFVRNSAGSNWFIHLGAGAQTIFGDRDDKAEFLNRITVAPTVSVGKWFSPYWGVRLKGQGGALHGFENDGVYIQHIRYYNVHLDAMWNLSNYWGAYSPGKVFNFTPYIGLGFGHRFQYDDDLVPPDVTGVSSDYHDFSDVLTVNGGIQFGFRLSKRVNLDFDLGAAIVPDYFDRVVQTRTNEAIVSASGGLTFKLGKTTFETVIPYDLELINELNGKINTLRSENDKLSKRPVACPESPTLVPTVTNEINYVPNVVFFRLNSAKVDENQEISVYNTAEFMKNTGEKIKVIGYADKSTGSDKYNLALSEKRAKAVAHELISKYGVPSQKITIEWKGSDEQPYPENNWNRVVIMSAD
jgi:hypothetical protein